MMGHITYKCGCSSGSCMICDGGLAMCKVCKLYEGGLTTECPGIVVAIDQSDDIYHGKLDFKDGQWCPGDGDMPCRNNHIQWQD